jgi:hypothetical protein
MSVFSELDGIREQALVEITGIVYITHTATTPNLDDARQCIDRALTQAIMDTANVVARSK